MTELVALHCGHLLIFDCQRTDESNTSFKTSVYRYLPYSKAFEVEKTITISIEGNWEIVALTNVENKITNTVCPCVALASIETSSVTVYAIENLEKHVAVLNEPVLLRELINKATFTQLSWFLFGGPRILCADYRKEMLVVVDTTATPAKKFNLAMPKMTSQPFLTNSCNIQNKTSVTFLGVSSPKPSLKIAQMQYASEELNGSKSGNLFGCSWVSFDVTSAQHEESEKFDDGTSVDETDFMLKVKEEEIDIPPAYCSIVTAVLQFLEDTVKKTLLATQYPQLVMVSTGSVVKCCDLPPDITCSALYMVGSVDSRVVIAVDGNSKSCCAISCQTFEILKTWEGVQHVSCGYISLHENISKCVFILKSSIQSDQMQIQPEQFVVICGSEDLMIENLESKIDLHQSHMNEGEIDEMDDLFMPSPPQHDQEEECHEASQKMVTSSLESIQKNLWREVDQMRSLQDKMQRVTDRTTAAVKTMNNHISLSKNNNSTPQVEPEELVDLFSGEPTVIDKPIEPKSSLKFIRSWQNIISDQWIVGFVLKNSSSRSFCNFAIMLTQNQEERLETGTKRNVRTSVLKPSNNVKTFGLEKNKCQREIFKDIKNFQQTCLPNDEIMVVAIGDIPEFSLSQTKRTFSATIFAQEIGNECQQFIFDAGKISLAASDIARGSLQMNGEVLATSPKSDNLIANLATLKAYSFCTSKLNASSDTNDVLSTIEVLLRSLGFTLIKEFSMWVCLKTGSLNFVCVKLQAVTRRNVRLTVYSRSTTELNLLLSFFKEQGPHDFCIQHEQNEAQLEKSTDLLPISALPSKSQSTLFPKRIKTHSSGELDNIPLELAVLAIEEQLGTNLKPLKDHTT